ncbi:amidophosphoribosyltransferase [Bacillus sp. FJAT-27225]|uniref:ComF family protein n=1 Tax=Bacillus sp. FJAT-27225 TaxID=1743144 RepID=UPI00080C29C4|nr:ComF family protein [Bacillus sp. FJAT-27225]OCA88256.1 amidophosphoribosyltransferase [Bacillus sp. FJAT-27225]
MIYINERCLLCGGESGEEPSWASLFLPAKKGDVCKNCRPKLKSIIGNGCKICGRMFNEQAERFSSEGVCHDCIRWESDPKWAGMLQQNKSLYVYNDSLKDVIAKFKYRGDYQIALAFSEETKNMIRSLKPDIIVPIPLSNERLYDRGFNQSEAILREAGIKWSAILTREHSEKQSKKSRQERIHLPQVFKTDAEVDGKRVLLVDDIYTTGSTLRYAAKCLKRAGAREIISFTIARG